MKRLTAFLLAVIVMMPLLLTSCWWQEDFEYELTEDGTGYRIVEYVGPYTRVIEFPESYKNKPVKEIGGNHWYRADEILIPATVERIADRLFTDGYLEFETVSVDPDNPNYCSIDGNLYTKDGKCLLRYGEKKREAAFTVPDTVTRIGHHAFRGNYWLGELTLPESVTRIDGYAFYSCDSLERISIPDTIERIGYGAFLRCDALVYNVSENCYWLGNEENFGVVLMKVKEDRQGLTEIVLGEEVRIISYGAFYGCDKLESVDLSDGLVSIGDSAFGKCAALDGIVIPKSVKHIDRGAFFGCASMKTAHFSDPEGWSAGGEEISPLTLVSPATAAAHLTELYTAREWIKK